MSCLLPQFKCLPDTFSVQFKTQLPKSRVPIYLLTQCNLSTMSLIRAAATAAVLDMEKLQLLPLEDHSNLVDANVPWSSPALTSATAVLDMEKLKLPSSDALSNSVTANRPWTYLDGKGPLTEVNFEASLPTETMLAIEEAVIAAASAEAVALAKAAVKVANDAAMKIGHPNTTKSDIKTAPSQSVPDHNSLFDRAHLAQPSEIGQLGVVGPADAEPTIRELELLNAEISSFIAVRSRRQTERKERRSRAAKKAAASAVLVKSESMSQKKCAVQDTNYLDPLRYLRGTTNTSRLLTSKEERQLSAGIQELLKSEKLYEELKERCGGEPTLIQWASAAGVDQKTLRERLSFGALCKEKMIKSNIRLVVSIAKNYQGVGMNLQDLVQEGCRGLIKAVEKFDAKKGFKFSTYAHWWIKQAVRKALSDHSRTIRLPFNMVEATYKVKETRNQLLMEKRRVPSEEEIAEVSGLPLRKVMAVLEAPENPISLDQKTKFNVKLSEVIADPEAETLEDLLAKKLMREDLKKALNSLNPKEKQVIMWRFGYEDGRMKTLQEIGEQIGVSRERIRQIESSAFRKLRNKRRNKNLQQYLLPQEALYLH
ncbi:hypothetical protein LguiA_010594 [Lonicera macranthoides]